MSVFNGAVARIILRYGVGAMLGSAIGKQLSNDTDLVLVLALGLGAATEAAYLLAKKKGWKL